MGFKHQSYGKLDGSLIGLNLKLGLFKVAHLISVGLKISHNKLKYYSIDLVNV